MKNLLMAVAAAILLLGLILVVANIINYNSEGARNLRDAQAGYESSLRASIEIDHLAAGRVRSHEERVAELAALQD